MGALFGAVEGDLLLIVADKVQVANKALSQLRVELGKRLGLLDPERPIFVAP